jgi:hypothetical protein
MGAHTARHCILGLEDPRVRRREIEDSVTRVRRKTGGWDIPFAYPNGQPGDFGSIDWDILRSLDVSLAMTTYPGPNHPDTPRYELRRNAVDMRMTALIFEGVATGLRDFPERPLLKRIL